MGKTIKGTKGPGFEYWSKRPNKYGGSIGRKAKTETHRRERLAAKRETQAG